MNLDDLPDQCDKLIGQIVEVHAPTGFFKIRLLSGDEVNITAGGTTYYEVLSNVDAMPRDRAESPQRNQNESDFEYNLRKYIQVGLMGCVQGIHSINDGVERLDARRVVLMHSEPGRFGWEDTHWWISQVSTICNQWLDTLFGNKRTFATDDFANFYRTNLNILGGQTKDPIQECATLSRFLYGLSSAYMLTGITRFYSAAEAAANYLCDTFRSPSHDQTYCFWKFGRRERPFNEDIVSSLNADDLGTYALYEQIYALSGLTQFYRVSQDRRIRDFIHRTIQTYQDFFFDRRKDGDPSFTGNGGYFSHIDPITMRPDTASLGQNRLKKNWNSIGDHIPAYLINLLLSIDPLPSKGEGWKELRALCWKMLDECVDNILKYFPERVADDAKIEDRDWLNPDGTIKLDNIKNPYVRERFYADWKPDKSWSWQQNRAIVGHNLKIAWNLTRCGHYYCTRASAFEAESNQESAAKYRQRARRCYDYAAWIGDKMAEVGIDLARGGIFDAVERNPMSHMPTEFTWGCTKDFWQQEQAILAYLILHGIDGEEESRFLERARYCNAFWNLFFLDRDNHRIRFRTSESGEPIVEGAYGDQAGHAIAGYHAFELSYLAHFYTRCYVPKARGSDDNFVVYFRPTSPRNVLVINTLPDFMRPDEVEILRVKINGLEVEGLKQEDFQISLEDCPEESTIAVEFRPKRRRGAQSREEIEKLRPTSFTFSARQTPG